jgi:hypothetical protein
MSSAGRICAKATSRFIVSDLSIELTVCSSTSSEKYCRTELAGKEDPAAPLVLK